MQYKTPIAALMRSVSHQAKRTFKRLHECRRGAVAIIFTLIFIPLFTFVGVAIDLNKVNAEQSAMQHLIDDAILSVQKDVHEETTKKEVEDSIKAILAANSHSNVGSYKIVRTIFNEREKTIGVVVRGNVQLFFANVYSLFGIDKRFSSYLVQAGTIARTAHYYVNYYLLLNNSAPMLFAATNTEAKRLKRETVIPCIDSGRKFPTDCSVYPKKLRDTRIHNDMHNGCEFACHSRKRCCSPPPPMQDSKVPQWPLNDTELVKNAGSNANKI